MKKYIPFTALFAGIVIVLALAGVLTQYWQFVAAAGILAVVTIVLHEAILILGIIPERPAQEQTASSAQQRATSEQKAALDKQVEATTLTNAARAKATEAPQQQALDTALSAQRKAEAEQKAALEKQLAATMPLQQEALKAIEANQAQVELRQHEVQAALERARTLGQSGPQQQELMTAMEVQKEAETKQKQAKDLQAAVLHQAAGPGNLYPPGIWGIIVGKDWRWSTSKFMAAMWTYILLFAVISLFLLYGFTKGAGKLELFQLDYLILIGSPIAAAVIAKQAATTNATQGTVGSITSSTPQPVTPQPAAGSSIPPAPVSAAPGSLSLPSQPAPSSNVQVFSSAPGSPQLPNTAQGGVQLISNDANSADLADFQYLCFNLILVVFFLWVFIGKPDEGLPELPATLLLLAGVTATGYATNKFLQTTPPPAINSVTPQRIIAGKDFILDIAGANFGEENPSSLPQLCQVVLNGRPLTYDPQGKTRIEQWHPEWIRVKLPHMLSIPTDALSEAKTEAAKINEAVKEEWRGFVPAGSSAVPAGSSGDVPVNLLVYDRSGRASQEKPVTINVSGVAPSGATPDTSSANATAPAT
jgi:multidrug efflux pump subunit AcrA (membrane-fusion protein)